MSESPARALRDLVIYVGRQRWSFRAGQQLPEDALTDLVPERDYRGPALLRTCDGLGPRPTFGDWAPIDDGLPERHSARRAVLRARGAGGA